MEYKYPSSLFKEKYDVAKNIRKNMLDVSVRIFERNIRKFKKATSYPYFVIESRKTSEDEIWHYFLCAESKSRLSKGVVGVFCVKLGYQGDSLSEVLVVEGGDDGSTRFELYDGRFFESYRKVHNISDQSDFAIVSRFLKENYISSKSYSEYKNLAMELKDDSQASGSFIVLFHINVNSVGVCKGIATTDDTGFIYFDYVKTSDFYKDRPEKLDKLSDHIIKQYLELEKCPWDISSVTNLKK